MFSLYFLSCFLFVIAIHLSSWYCRCPFLCMTNNVCPLDVELGCTSCVRFNGCVNCCLFFIFVEEDLSISIVGTGGIWVTLKGVVDDMGE